MFLHGSILLGLPSGSKEEEEEKCDLFLLICHINICHIFSAEYKTDESVDDTHTCMQLAPP